MTYRTVTASECAISGANCVNMYSALSIRGIASEVVCDIGRRVRISLLQGDRSPHVRIAEWGDGCHYSLLSVMIINLRKGKYHATARSLPFRTAIYIPALITVPVLLLAVLPLAVLPLAVLPLAVLLLAVAEYQLFMTELL
jgi:hypothetical protein